MYERMDETYSKFCGLYISILLYFYVLFSLYFILNLNFKEFTFMQYITNHGWTVCLNPWSFLPRPPSLS